MVAGEFHACAWLEDGRAFCWGRGTGGQLGDGTRATHSFPVPVASLGSVVGMAAGSGHTCAWLDDATARCWGENDYGQLGDGTQSGRVLPTRVPLDDVAGMTAGRHHTCAFTGVGVAHCWGRNVFGELGSGTTGLDRSTPTPVDGLGSVDGMTAGAFHTCAWTAANVWCWGNNESGQLGLGTLSLLITVHPPTPLGLTGVAGMSAGGGDHTALLSPGHTCAWLLDGTALCWGFSQQGQVGALGTYVENPTRIDGLVDVTSMGAGARHTCAAHGDGGLSCWGHGERGELGREPHGIQFVTVPYELPSPTQTLGVAAGNAYSCAWDVAGRAWCWGSSSDGRLGHLPANLPAEVGR